jgi:hypothetical protein
MLALVPTSTLEAAASLEATCVSTAPTLVELQAKAARYDWLVSGQRIRQGKVVSNFGSRSIDKNADQSLMTFTYWCSEEQLATAIDAEIAKE